MWWLWSRRDVYDMSLTICHNSPAPNYGSRVPVDTAPGPVPVYRAQKIYPTSQLAGPTAGTCRCGKTATSTNVDELRHVIDNTPVVAQNGHATTVQNSTSCNCGSSAVPSTSAENCRTAQQGQRPPCSATVECPWSDEQFGPWNLPLRHDGEMNLLDLETGMSTTLYSNWGMSMVRRTVWTMRRRTASAPRKRCRRPGRTATAETPQFQQSEHGHHVANVLLVHNGYDVEHHGPANQGKEHSARCIVTSNTSLAHTTATVLFGP